MATSLTIPKILNYPPGMNYQLLRREGMRHLERLGSAIWTDFNSHDPGVTILEVLCYALTDLGYRSQLPDADIFSPSGKNRKPFFTAAEVLPNAPVTALDFRKLLIDIDGVKNAWLEPYKEKNPVLQFDIKTGNPVQLPDSQKLEKYLTTFSNLGAGGIQLDFSAEAKQLWNDIEAAKQAGDKNIDQKIKAFYAGCCIDLATGKRPDADSIYSKALILYMVDTQFNQVQSHLLSTMKQVDSETETVLFIMLNNFRKLKSAIEKYNQNQKTGDIETIYLRFDQPAAIQQISELVASLATSIFLKEKMIVVPAGDTDTKFAVFQPKGLYQIFLQLEEDRQADQNKIKKEAWSRLNTNRAFCEDFGELKIIENVGVGLNAAIEIQPDSDVIQVFAELLFAIETFLSPHVRVYSLQEMMDKYTRFTLTANSLDQLKDAGLPEQILLTLDSLLNKTFNGKQLWQKAVLDVLGVEDAADYESLILNFAEKIYESHPVFQGPVLTHGFIDDTELEVADWKRTVYRSDLFQEMSGVVGVLRVTKLSIYKCPKDDENPRTVESEWCLSFDCDCQPSLGLNFLLDATDTCSVFNFSKAGNLISLNESAGYEVLDRVAQLRGMHAKIDQSGRMDLSVPQGIQRDDLAEYTSIQEEFPRNYHLGKDGVSKNELPGNKAKVNQLKGYLMFFDQILANYLQHLNQIREILALDGDLTQPALYQPLYDVPKVQPLLKALAPGGDWDLFKSNQGNAYIKALKSITEGSPATQKLRKNQILDHLLARFGEQFNEFVLDLFRIERPLDDVADDTAEISDWLEDKQRFLKNIPALGSDRGRGFNYRAEQEDDKKHFWDSDNVEGFKKRVMAQLGIADWSRRTISSSPQFRVEVKTEMFEKKRRYRFGIKQEWGFANFLLFSKNTFSQAASAQKAGDAFLGKAAYIENYGIFKNDKGIWFVGFGSDSTGSELNMDKAQLISEPFRDQEDAQKRLNQISKLVDKEKQNDSFHVVEHILLRPLDEFYKLLKQPAESLFPLNADIYSFCLTVFVPAWGDRFKDSNQYLQFQQVVRSELPAHTFVRFVSLKRNQMLNFEGRYYEWLSQLSRPDATISERRNAANDLIDIMNQI